MENESIIIYFTTFAFTILGFWYKNSISLFTVQIIWFYILLAGNTASIDMLVNLSIYEEADVNGFGIYNGLCLLGKYLFLDYLEFNALLVLIATILLGGIIKKCSKNPCAVMSFILIYPLIDMVIQKRWFIATSVIFPAIYCLLKDGKVYKLLFLVLVLVASLIHEAALGYVVFILLPVLKKTKNKRMFIIAMFSISAIFCIFLTDLLGQISLIGEARAELYFSVLHEKIKYPILSFILWSGLQIGFLFLFYRLYKWGEKTGYNATFVFNAENLLIANFIALLFIPFYYWEPVFWRINRNILIFDYIAITNYLPINQIYNVSLIRNLIAFLFYLFISSLLLYCGASAGYESVVKPVFNDNILNDFLGYL